MTNRTNELEELRGQVEALKQMLLEREEAKVAQEEKDDLTSDTLIQVMSMIPWGLNLKVTDRYHIKFNKFGQIRPVMFGDLVKILENQRPFQEQGYFYILNKNAIQKLGLEEIYDAILTKDKLEKAFECGNNAVEIYKSATEKQRGIINHVIVQKLRNDEPLDLNIVTQIGRIAKVDFVAKAEELKALFSPEEETKK